MCLQDFIVFVIFVFVVQDKIIFSGDSPNDEPMFEKLKYTIAVANIKTFLDRLKYFPAYITENNSAKGFCEAVEIILGKRRVS